MKNLIKILIPTLLLIISNSGYSQCDYAAGSTIAVSSSGFEAGASFSHTYVLVENSSNNIADISLTGSFASVGIGAYRIYAVNYEGVIPSALVIDSAWTSIESFAAAAGNCLAILGPKDDTIYVCESVCHGTSISVTASGFENGVDYSQTYVLVNKNDSIYASNTTGTFSQLDYLDSGAVKVFAVNTNDATVASEISDGGLWNDIVTMELSTCTEYIGGQQFFINTCAVLSNEKIKIFGITNETNNVIKWTQSTSEDDYNYRVFKSSYQTNDFIEIGIIAGSGVNSEFEYVDFSPNTNEYYKVVLEANKKSFQSNIINLHSNLENDDLIDVYPNPSSDILNVKINSFSGSGYRLEMQNATGQSVLNKKVESSFGTSLYSLSISNFDDGMYFLMISGNNKVVTKKVIKKNN